MTGWRLDSGLHSLAAVKKFCEVVHNQSGPPVADSRPSISVRSVDSRRALLSWAP